MKVFVPLMNLLAESKLLVSQTLSESKPCFVHGRLSLS